MPSVRDKNSKRVQMYNKALNEYGGRIINISPNVKIKKKFKIKRKSKPVNKIEKDNRLENLSPISDYKTNNNANEIISNTNQKKQPKIVKRKMNSTIGSWSVSEYTEF